MNKIKNGVILWPLIIWNGALILLNEKLQNVRLYRKWIYLKYLLKDVKKKLDSFDWVVEQPKVNNYLRQSKIKGIFKMEKFRYYVDDNLDKEFVNNLLDEIITEEPISNDIDELYSNLEYSDLLTVRISYYKYLVNTSKLNEFLETIIPERMWICDDDNGNNIVDCLLTTEEYNSIPKLEWVSSHDIPPDYRRFYKFPLKMYRTHEKV